MLGLDHFKEAFNEIVQQTADAIKQRFKDEMPTFQSNYKFVYSEAEAAEFLGIDVAQLKKYRRNEQINFIAFPKSSDIEKESQRTRYYSYYLTDLLNFAEAYHKEQFAVRNTYKFKEVIEISQYRK